MKQPEILAFFDAPLLRDVVVQPAWLKAIKTLIAKIEKNPDVPNPPTELVEPMYKSLQPLQKVMVLHGLRSLLFSKFENTNQDLDELEFRCSPIDDIVGRHYSPSANSASEIPVERLSTISERWVPQIAYYVSSDTRSVEVEVDGHLLALIKPGELRQNNDLFLYEFYKKMKTMLSLPASLDNLFLPSYPCKLPFYQLKPRSALSADAEFVVSARGSKHNRFMHMPLRENISNQESVFYGGLQEFMTVPTISTDNMLVHRTLLLIFVCILNCRDLKSDGIIGSVIVDCEDFLEFKKGSDTLQAFPKIHVPFTEDLLLQRLDMAVLRHVNLQLKQLDWLQLENFVTSFSYQASQSQVSKANYARDERLTYQDPKPNFGHNRLLSQAQIAVLKNNIASVQNALEILEKLPDCSTHDLLKLFDPVWADLRDRYIACQQTAVNQKFVFFSPDKKKKIDEFARYFSDGLDAKDLVGSLSSAPPSPDIDTWRRRSSPLLFSRDASPTQSDSGTTQVFLAQSSGF